MLRTGPATPVTAATSSTPPTAPPATVNNSFITSWLLSSSWPATVSELGDKAGHSEQVSELGDKAGHSEQVSELGDKAGHSEYSHKAFRTHQFL